MLSALLKLMCGCSPFHPQPVNTKRKDKDQVLFLGCTILFFWSYHPLPPTVFIVRQCKCLPTACITQKAEEKSFLKPTVLL